MSLQQLEILRIGVCCDLMEIFLSSGEHDDDDFSCFCCFTNLKELEVYECGKLKTIFPMMKSTGQAPHPQTHCRLPKLQKLLLRNNTELEHVFGHQNQVEVEMECPSLEKLMLKGCPKMSQHFVASQLIKAVSAKQLRSIELGNLRGTSLFSLSVAQSMVQLQVLKVRECNELKQIIFIEEDGSQAILSIGAKVACFPRLKELEVTDCKSILKHLIGDQREEEGDKVGRDFWLPQLKKLKLEQLPNLINLWHGESVSSSWPCKDSDWNYVIRKWPALRVLDVLDCPRFSTYFVADRESQLQARAAQQSRSIDLGKFQEGKFMMQLRKDDKNDQLLSFYLVGLCLEKGALDCVWTGHPQDIDIFFSSLRYVIVAWCGRLKQLFTTTIARSLRQLEWLTIKWCGQLEQVFTLDGVEDGSDAEAQLRGPGLECLRILEVIRCGKLKTILPVSKNDCRFQNLEFINVDENGALEHVFSHQSGTELDAKLSFENLRTLKVSNCSRLKTVCPMNSKGCGHLPRLEELELKNNAELEHVFFEAGMEFSCGDLRNIIVQQCRSLKMVFPIPIGGRNLPKLESLRLESNAELEHVFGGPKKAQEEMEFRGADFGNLATLIVRQCGKLKTVFPELLPSENNAGPEDVGFGVLRIVEVQNCWKLKALFPIVRGRFHLPKLEEIVVDSNAELEHLFGYAMEGRTEIEGGGKDINVLQPQLSPSTLEVLVVWGCPHISAQFFSQISNQLQAPARLTTLSLEKIKGVEEVIQLGRRENVDKLLTFDLFWLNLCHLQQLKCVWKGPAQNVAFSNLNAVVVKHCNELKQLFTTTIARSMHKLKFLTIEKCSELEHVVVADQKQVFDSNKTVLFPILEWVRLKDLPMLISFCPSTDMLKVSSKKQWFKVEGCPNIIQGSWSSQQQNMEIEEAAKENEVQWLQ